MCFEYRRKSLNEIANKQLKISYTHAIIAVVVAVYAACTVKLGGILDGYIESRVLPFVILLNLISLVGYLGFIIQESLRRSVLWWRYLLLMCAIIVCTTITFFAYMWHA